MISRELAIELSDWARQQFQNGIAESTVWSQLREGYPDANVFERRRIIARARQLVDYISDIKTGTPPIRLNVLYPLPPSTEAAGPYLLESTWTVYLDVDDEITPRNLIVPFPNNSLWTTVLNMLAFAVDEMAEGYDAEDDPDVDLLLVR